MPKHAYTIKMPLMRTSPVVFASPHSGNDYPDWFVRRSLLCAETIRSSEDAFVDQLFDAAPEFGAPLLLAGAPRAFLDLNRAADELDPALIRGVRKMALNPRVASGLGVIPRVVANSRPIYSGKLSLAEAQERITGYWQPYHAKLASLLDETRQQFGRAVLVDCHSMPHEAIENVSFSGAPPQVVLGDRFGASSDGEIVDAIEAAFLDAGLRVSRNTPFAGAYVTQQYGRPSRKQHAIQVEIDRSLYMDEKTVSPHDSFADFQALIREVVGKIAKLGLASQQLAAE